MTISNSFEKAKAALYQYKQLVKDIEDNPNKFTFKKCLPNDVCFRHDPSKEYKDDDFDLYRLPFKGLGFNAFVYQYKINDEIMAVATFVNLHDFESDSFEMTYNLMPEMQGKGKGAEIVAIFISQFRNDLYGVLGWAAVEIKTCVLHDNIASQKISSRCISETYERERNPNDGTYDFWYRGIFSCPCPPTEDEVFDRLNAFLHGDK